MKTEEVNDIDIKIASAEHSDISDIDEMLSNLSPEKIREVREYVGYLLEKEKKHKAFVGRVLKAEQEHDSIICNSVEEAMQAILSIRSYFVCHSEHPKGVRNLYWKAVRFLASLGMTRKNRSI